MKFFKWITQIFTKDFWVGDFADTNYHPECFDCKLDKYACAKCEYRVWGPEPGHVLKDGKWIKCEY